MGHVGKESHGDNFFYVQRTELSAPFFLAHRELAAPAAYGAQPPRNYHHACHAHAE